MRVSNIILEGSDPNNQNISFIIISQPANGLVDINSFNVCLYFLI